MVRSAIATALVLALALTAHAEHGCTTYETSQPEVTTGTPVGVWYVDNDFSPDWWTIWVYEESNGISGLQRGDEVVDDTCHGMIRSDTIIF